MSERDNPHYDAVRAVLTKHGWNFKASMDWLYTKNNRLDNARPIDLLRNGRGEEVTWMLKTFGVVDNPPIPKTLLRWTSREHKAHAGVYSKRGLLHVTLYRYDRAFALMFIGQRGVQLQRGETTSRLNLCALIFVLSIEWCTKANFEKVDPLTIGLGRGN